MQKENIRLMLLLLIFFTFSSATLVVWSHKGINTVTGDEPHYIVMASGIARYGVFEQTVPYKAEFESREIYKSGLAAQNANPSPENTHAIQGLNGLFNVHNVGLPLILTLPFLVGGVLGVKICMLILAGLAVIAAWKVSAVFCNVLNVRFFSTLAISVSLPLIPASNQVYPDILAGTIALSGLYWFMTVNIHRSCIKEILWAASIAFLPWLQIKFSAACVLLVVALAIKVFVESKDIKRVLFVVVPAIVSFLVLFSYNDYAFGRLSGPYQSGALELSKTAFMVLLGLHFDQNQGFLLQNPLMLIGVFSVGALFLYNKQLALLWLLVFLSLIVPNALHPNWYGGGSFSGRFAWAAAIVFMLPAILGLGRLFDVSAKVFGLVVWLAVLIQALFFYLYSFGGVDLYNKGDSVGAWNYSIFYFPIYSWMPVLNNSELAYSYGPNYGWFILISFIFVFGCVACTRERDFLLRHAKSFLCAGGGVVLISGFVLQSVDQKVLFFAKSMPSQSGRIEQDARVAEEGIDGLGFVSYGPYFPLRKGSYQVVVRYSSNAPADKIIGEFDVFNASENIQLKVRPLSGTGGKKKEMHIVFEVGSFLPKMIEFRSHWAGMSNIKIYAYELKPL